MSYSVFNTSQYLYVMHDGSRPYAVLATTVSGHRAIIGRYETEAEAVRRARLLARGGVGEC